MDTVKKYQITINELPDAADTATGFIDLKEDPWANLREGYYQIKPFTKDGDFNDKCAYYLDGYFYLYRGAMDRSIAKEPGIYWDAEAQKYYVILCDGENPDHLKYSATPDHISKLNPKSISDDLKDNGEEIYARQRVNSKHICVFVVNPTDDVLKRLMKMAYLRKNIDIDQMRGRFADKNALFNFKSVMKGDGTLSMLLFNRGAEALNLKYTITVEEIDPENPVGEPLTEPIVVSSTDTFAECPNDDMTVNTKIGQASLMQNPTVKDCIENDKPIPFATGLEDKDDD